VKHGGDVGGEEQLVEVVKTVEFNEFLTPIFALGDLYVGVE